MGTPKQHNTFEAEVTGAILVLWIMGNTPGAIGKAVLLYTDNQSLVSTLPHPKATSGQYLLSSLQTAIEGSRCKLAVKWISSHSKVKGNEEVDRFAKDTSAEHSSTRAALSHILRSLLLISTSVLKQGFMRKLKEK